MNHLIEIATNHWNVPLRVIAFKKQLLISRGILSQLNLATWNEQILAIDNLSEDEQALLRELILAIDETVETFDLDTLIALTSDTMARYLDNRFVLLKYAPSVTYGDLWNNWHHFTRGSVFDLESVKLITYNLKKFFNLLEKPSTQLVPVLAKMKRGVTTQYIKEDGSNVSVSFDDCLFVSTPGGFDSDQANLSRELLSRKHPAFVEAIAGELSPYTFVFEYVSPFNQIVVHYGKEELILLHVLDKRDGSILSVETVQELAKQYGFRPCRTVTENFEKLISDSKDAEKYPAREHEGWVVRIDEGEETFFLKLKCADYAALHRVVAQALNPRWILEAIIDETIDDKIAQVESEDVRELVQKMIRIFYDFNESKKERLLAAYKEVPLEQWASDALVVSYETFSSHVLGALPEGAPDTYLSRVRSFLDGFSKGKAENPKEELLSLAKHLWETQAHRFTFLPSFDAYTAKLSNWVKGFIKELKEDLANYIDGKLIVDSRHALLSTVFEEYVGFWDEKMESLFEGRRDDFNRLVNAKRENLTPNEFALHDYAKKKSAYLEQHRSFFARVKDEMTAFLLRENANIDSTLQGFVPEELVINDEMYSFIELRNTFETVELPILLPTCHPEDRNIVLKNFMMLLRGLEQTDDSYEVAKRIFSTVPENVKDQRSFFAARGKFSGYVNQKVPQILRPIIFELFDKTEQERLRYVNEFTFYSLIDVVTDASVDVLSEFQLDFREIVRTINEKNADE